MKKCYKFGEILLPKNTDVKNWAVVACDQYTSDPDYWNGIESSVVDPTTLRLVFPEVYLGQNDETRIENIIAKQNEYLSGGIFEKVEGTVLVKRSTPYGNVRYGLMCLVDLSDYSVEKGAKSLIRATEGLVESRIPPRVKIRKNCPLELPHIMLLIDDPERTVIEPLKSEVSEVLYDGDLNGNGGHVTGYAVTDTARVEKALDALIAKSESKYGEKLAFLVGDGNHSLATAKACVDPKNPLSGYALIEVVNIFDEGLKFEPIHRVVFGADEKFVEALKSAMSGETSETTIYVGAEAQTISFPSDPIDGVKKIQAFIDDYVNKNGLTVDYVHGADDLKKICARGGAVGIELKPIDKNSFFTYIVKNGTLPRKTFSMGEANEKRYYIEARKVK